MQGRKCLQCCVAIDNLPNRSIYCSAKCKDCPQSIRRRAAIRQQDRFCISCKERIPTTRRSQAKTCSLKCTHKVWKANNRDHVRERHRAWRSRPENAKKVVDRVMRWRKQNPEKFKENYRQFVGNRRARIMGSPERTFTAAAWQELLSTHDHRCHYCGSQPKRLTQDHKVPLSKGGTHTKDNIVPACKSCNSRKGTKSYEQFASAA